MSEFAALLDVASKVTIIGGLLAIIWGGIKKVWVWGWLFDQLVAMYEARLTAKDAELAKKDVEIAEWRQRALDQLGINKKTVDNLEKLVNQANRTHSAPISQGGAGQGGPLE